jgi:hypothetical protein
MSTIRRRPKPGHGTTAVGVDLSSRKPSSSPTLPHERDEGAGMTGGVASERIAQGHRDLKRGIEDTSRAPEADRTYRRLKK